MAQTIWLACYTGLPVLMQRRNAYFCFKQGWEGFPVTSPLATVVSGARTEVKGKFSLVTVEFCWGFCNENFQ